MPRFVLLHHSLPDASSHYDLMLVRGGALATWRIPAPLAELPPGGAEAVPLGEHRLHYLTHEGDIGGGRGGVRRVDEGVYEATAWDDARIVAAVCGRAGAGFLELMRGAAGGTDRVRWGAEPPGRGRSAFERAGACLIGLIPRGQGRVLDALDGNYSLDEPVVVRVGDLPVALNPRVRLERSMLYGRYERGLIRFAASLLAPGDAVVDAGAFIGWLSFHFLRAVGRGGAVHAFEPVPEHHARLAAAFAGARAAGYRCEAVSAALGERPGAARLTVGNRHNPGFNTLVPGFAAERWRDREIEVPVQALDDHLDARGIGRVKLLKVDVEGAEGGVLRGARRALEARRIAHLIVEMSPQAEEESGKARGDTARFLEGLGYRGFLLARGRPRPLPGTWDFWTADTYWVAPGA